MPASAVSDRTQANDFARKFRLALEALNWSRTRCARELGVDKSVISRWASGVARPTEHNLTRLTAIIQRTRPRFQPSAWRLDPTPFAALLKAEVAPASHAASAGSRGQPSIAVLPFEDRSAEPENDHFARGMAEDIITELSRSRTLLVISRGSSFSYQGRDVDRQQIGRELGVRYLLEGSVRRADSRLRVTAQLIEAETGVHVWSERYDRALTDFFAVLDELTAAVSSEIEPAVEMVERQRALRKPPDNLDAWEAYQRAQALMDNREFDAARVLWERAAELDPGFALPHAMLSFQDLSDGVNGHPAYWDLYRSSEANALKAIGREYAEPLGHAALAWARCMAGDQERAKQHASQALDLGRGCWWGWAAMGLATIGLREFDAAEEALAESLRLAPRGRLVRMTRMFDALLHFARGEFEVSCEAAQAIIDWEPAYIHSYWIRLASLGHLGDKTKSRSALKDWLRICGAQASMWAEIGIPVIGQNEMLGLTGLRKAGWKG
jgi:adenylate cyclase